VETEGGCIVWGGAVQLSPVDDILISVEKALNVDSEGQMIASVLSKKAAVGSTHVVIDIPVGETAKVRSRESALYLQHQMEDAGKAIGLNVKTIVTNGSQPVGKGIGPALEAIDILDVLKNSSNAPHSLKERSLELAGSLLELSGKWEAGKGVAQATHVLESGLAYQKFMRICEAQGGFRLPSRAKFQYDVLAETKGMIASIDNRTLARVAKLAGAPRSPASGLEFHAPLGKRVNKGDVLYTIHAESEGELQYARNYAEAANTIISIV
jgi:thymidine phosphorylase